MNFIYVFGAFAIIAYVVQTILGFLQIKHFNQVYGELRRKGKVAIGRKKGRIKAGTLVLFAVKDEGEILDVRLMQGVTIFSKFRRLDQFIGQDLHYIDKYHPLVRKENKLTQEAMEDAREIYLRVTTGNYEEEPAHTPLQQVGSHLGLMKESFKIKMKDVFNNGHSY